MKKCTKCKEVKPLSEFGKNARMKDGLQIYCKPCRRGEYKSYYEANKEYVLSRTNEYKRRNPEKAKAAVRTSREKNRDHYSRYMRSYRRSKPWVHTATNANLRAKAAGARGRVSSEDVREILEQNPQCIACGSDEQITIDHVIPLAKGGENSVGNLQVLCGSCNSVKHDKTIDYRYGPQLPT